MEKIYIMVDPEEVIMKFIWSVGCPLAQLIEKEILKAQGLARRIIMGSYI